MTIALNRLKYPFIDYMWLHIRGVGEWTNRLYSYFEEEQQKLHLLNEELPGSANSKTSTVDTLESSKMKKLQTCDINLLGIKFITALPILYVLICL